MPRKKVRRSARLKQPNIKQILFKTEPDADRNICRMALNTYLSQGGTKTEIVLKSGLSYATLDNLTNPKSKKGTKNPQNRTVQFILQLCGIETRRFWKGTDDEVSVRRYNDWRI